MRIGWLHDWRLEERPGGAQLTNELMIRAAPPWAEVVRCWPGGMRPADAYILNNVKRFSQEELEAACSRPYVKYEHDYWDCPQPWQREWIGPVYAGARGALFLSPLHRDSFLRLSGVRPKRMACVPSPIDVETFRAARRRAGKRRGVVWLGEFQPHKGVMEACRWAARHEPVDFYGWGPLKPFGPGVRFLGRLPCERVPGVLARYEKLLFLPRWPEPFGRVVAEAKLAGCELICSPNVGALSWGWRTLEEWEEGVGEAPQRFWQVMKEWLS